MMTKQGVILVVAALLAVILCGAASAADSSTTGGEGNISDVNVSENVDPVLWVNVTYQYADDKINPGISVTDSDNNSVNFDKTKYSDTLYKLNFTYTGVTNETLFNVLVTAPGYRDKTQQVVVNQAGSDPEFIGGATFQMQATENYKLGREVTAKADQLLNFNTADGVLCITTAGLTYRNGTTTEDCLEGILNGSHGEISYGLGNLLTLRKSRVDPVDFAFITKRGTQLTAVFFKNGSLTPVYHGTFSETMSQDHWTNVIVPAFGDDAFGYVSLANAWDVGLATDILRQAAFHGHVCLGTISGQAMIQTLLKYYPPGNLMGGLEATSYKVIGVPGNSDDDAFIYSMDATVGKRAYVGFDTTDLGATSDMVGFIRWNDASKLGTLIIMRFNEDAVTQLYKTLTGNTAYSGISSELQFNKWLVGRLQNSPESLVEIVYAFGNLTEAQANYLNGGTGSSTVTDAHGLDINYILNQTNLIPAVPVNMVYTIGNLNPAQIKAIGTEAAEKAIEMFKTDGIDLEKDDSKLTVFTSAGYVRVNGQVVDMTMDGIEGLLGSRLSRATLLPIHSALWGNLWFQFTLENPNGTVTSKTIYYDSVTGLLNATNDTKCGIANVVLYDPPYDALMGWLWHNHVCGGSSPGYLITDYIYDNYPVGEDEKYIFVSTSVSCRDDIYSYLLGVSPGAGTYYDQRIKNNTSPSGNGTMVGYIIVWNKKTNTGKVAIIDWVGPKFATGSTSYEEYIRLYWGDYTSPNLVLAPKLHVEAERLITQNELNTILSGGDLSGNALQFIMGLPIRTMEDFVPVQGGSETPNGGSNQGTSTGSSTGSGLITSTGSGTGRFSSGSVGIIGTAVNAATQTTTDAGAQPSAGDSGKSYEVTKTGTGNSDDTPWGTYAVVGIVSVLALAGVGFFLKGGMFGK